MEGDGKRVLVTGAAGFIGSHLCEALLARGADVVAVDSFAPHYPRELKEINIAGIVEDPRCSFHQADLSGAGLDDVLEGVEWVFHLAARPGVRDSWDHFDDYVHSNIVAAKALLDACVGRGVRFVYASSSSVYGDAAQLPVGEAASLRPISPYGASKVMLELMAGAYHRARGIDVIGLRYFTAYGPRQRPDMGLAKFIGAALEGRSIPIYGDGRQMRDFTYVADIVEGTIAAAERGRSGMVYNLASGTPVRLLEVLDLIGENLHQELQLVFEEPKVGDVRDTWGATELAQRELGYSPRTTLREGVAAQVAETRRRGQQTPLAGRLR